MTTVLDMSDASAAWDNTEALTLTIYRNDVPAMLTIAVAKRSALTGGMVLSLGTRLTGREIVFSIPASQLAGNGILEGDKLTDAAGRSYSVVKADLLAGGSRFRCVCLEDR